MSARLLAICIVAAASPVHADDALAKPIVGFRVKGHSKVTEETLGYLAHVHLGDQVSAADIPQLTTALISSELFETVEVAIEDAPGGALVVATVDDKLSWIAAPTVYVLPGNRAFGVGYAQNDLGGRDQKLLLYGQLGTQQDILLATFLDPAVHGSRLTYRLDLYLERREIDEYENPPTDAKSFAISRSTQFNFLDAGALIGWNLRWWAVADFRLRGAWVTFREPHDPNGNVLTTPEKDGWDITAQARLTLDHRVHNFGVTSGAYLQTELEQSIPGLDSYGYGFAMVRAYYSWVFFCEHQLELRSMLSAGYHLPFHEELALGGVQDLRGYPTDMFRGDVNTLLRAEYSVPVAVWWKFKFRALGFVDSGYSGFHARRAQDRDYLPNQLGPGVYRDDVGIGIRVYVKAVVLPLLGLDLGYGIEGHSPEVYFELGLTDF
jgi:outer membrane protein assembly factor BamA